MANRKASKRRGSFVLEAMLIATIMVTVTSLFASLVLQIRQAQQALVQLELSTKERLRLAHDLRQELHQWREFTYVSGQEIEGKLDGNLVRFYISGEKVKRIEAGRIADYEISATGKFEFDSEYGVLTLSVADMRTIVVPNHE